MPLNIMWLLRKCDFKLKKSITSNTNFIQFVLALLLSQLQLKVELLVVGSTVNDKTTLSSYPTVRT